MTTFANASETIIHMELMYNVYGTTKLMIWKTADGKCIDSTVLDTLAKKGLVRRTGGNGRSAYSTPTYSLVV